MTWEPQYADWAPHVSCGACGLPWQVQQATLFRDKVAMKEAALSGGMPCPPFKRVSCKCSVLAGKAKLQASRTHDAASH